MRPINEYPPFRTKVLSARTLHIFGVGFEERCLGYARYLANESLKAHEHVFLCVVPPDDKVSGLLRSQRALHLKEIQTILPAARTGTIDEIDAQIDGAPLPENICLDISTLPRLFIFRLLRKLLEKGQNFVPIYIIYTYPREYAYGALEEPAADVEYVFTDNPKLTKGRIAAVFLPGFDRACTDIALTYIRAATGPDSVIKWHFPFPGRVYAFYERALDSHIDLVKDSTYYIYPQHEIALAFRRFTSDIQSLRQMPVFFVPLGPRVTCVSTLLTVSRARAEGIAANIVVPIMRNYTSVRSEGAQIPLIEQIPYPKLD